jgi:acyl dehydratase
LLFLLDASLRWHDRKGLMTTTLHYEDFSTGQTFAAGGYTITKESAIAFAREYDPQYFHIDEEAAKSSFFGGLAVSGWQTAAASMWLKLQTPLGKVAGGLIGMGLEHLKWPRPVYPGDTLRIVVTITGTRVSNSRPSHGVVQYKVETYNQNDALVCVGGTAVMVPKRGA